MKTILTLIAASTLALPTLAAEPLSGPYARLQVGSAQIDEKKLGIDDRASAARAVAGYQFSPHWGIEAGFVRLGETTSRVNVAGRPTALRLSSSGITLGGVAKLPLGDQGVGPFLSATAGVAWLESKGRVLQGGSAVDLKKESKATGYWGVAAGYDFSPNFGVSLNVERFQTGKRAKADSTMVSLGATYRF